MRIKMVTCIAGPSLQANAGEVIEVPSEIAVGLISGNYAVAVGMDEKVPPIETASVDEPMENAAMPAPRGRPRGRGRIKGDEA